MPRSLTTDEARKMAAARKTYGSGSGRPRFKAKRCVCGKYTVKTANARYHTC
jgi:hypothetical protein